MEAGAIENILPSIPTGSSMGFNEASLSDTDLQDIDTSIMASFLLEIDHTPKSIVKEIDKIAESRQDNPELVKYLDNIKDMVNEYKNDDSLTQHSLEEILRLAKGASYADIKTPEYEERVSLSTGVDKNEGQANNSLDERLI